MKNTGVKIYITILSIITVICIIFGSVYHIGGTVSKWLINPIFHISLFDEKGESDSLMTTYDDPDDPVERIEIDGNVFNLTVTQGNSVSVAYDGIDKLKPEVKLKNGTLSIKQPKKNVNIKNLSDVKCDLTITVPKEGINAMSVSLDMGNIDMTGVIIGRLDIDADMGNIEGSALTVQNASFDADMGNIKIKSFDFKDLSANADMGNIQISTDKDLSGYDIELSAKLGRVSYNGQNYPSEYKQSGSAGSAHMDADMGNVELK